MGGGEDRSARKRSRSPTERKSNKEREETKGERKVEVTEILTKIGEGVEVETEIMIRNAEEVEVEIGMTIDVEENRRMGLQANVPSLKRPKLRRKKKKLLRKPSL
jgi:hypothetical protein